MNRRRASALLAALLLAPARGAQPLPGQAPEAAQRDVQALRELLARAAAEFEGPEQGRSIASFDRIIEMLEALRRPGPLPSEGRELLAQAYEYRGRAYFNIGLPERAAESFRSLVELDPQRTLSRDKVSPKVVDFFAALKGGMVGRLAVSSRPPGARVTLDGEFLSLTDFFPLEVLAGEYTVEVSREGYSTEVRQLSLAPRATEVLEVTLTRVAASFVFLTEPAGVEIWLDGELRATTGPALAPDQQAEAQARGLDPARASARTEVASVALGPHAVELRKRCFEPVTLTLDAREPLDYEAAPVRLEPSLASLTLTSDPPGARILVDGEPMGLTPRRIEGVCSGRHRIEVKHAAGKFVRDVELARDEELSLDCPIRPTLAFLGAAAATPAAERALPEAQQALLRQLAGIASLNVVPAARDGVEGVLQAEALTLQALVPEGGADPDRVRRAGEGLASELEVQGLLWAVLPEERLQRSAALYLLAAGNARADRWDVTFTEPASYARFIAAVDQKLELYQPWTGLLTVDVLETEGVPVLRVVPGSPAALAGVQPGERVLALDGRPLATTAELLVGVAARKPGERLALRLRGPADERELTLALGKTPREVPLDEPSLLYNKVMVDLRQELDGHPGSEAAAYARLNLALCAMRFGDYAAAHARLLEAKDELPERPGLSRGTALYYLGLAFERLGDRYRREAAEAYRAAAAARDATLLDNDGPLVAPLAARRAQP